PVQDVVDSCRTGKIVEDDQLTLETEDGATKVGLRLPPNQITEFEMGFLLSSSELISIDLLNYLQD
ncbi:hypothetical protein Tco_1307103, partial [Tanacetum coccineum]